MATLNILRRILAAMVLFSVGMLLFAASVASETPGGQLLGLVVVAGWGSAGAAVLAGSAWGRVLGLVVAAIGLLAGWSLAAAGVDSPLTDVMFSPPDATRWYVVMPAGYLFAVLSGLAGLLLLLPFRPAETPAAKDTPGGDDSA